MKRSILIIILLSFVTSLYSQDKMKVSKWRKTERDSMENAQHLFDEGNYVMALPMYDALLHNHPKELYLKYVTGLCGLYRSDKHDDALRLLSEVYEKNKKTAEIELDLAKANHLNYKFDEALALLELYKKKVKKIEAKKQEQIDLLLHYCDIGKKLVAHPLPAKLTNIGGPINTEASEYVPVISSDESVMIYTYRGKKSIGGLQNVYNQPDPYGFYYEDVYISYRDSTDNFSEPKDIGPTINSSSNDAAVALSSDGQKLFIYKDDGTNGGDLYLSLLSGRDWSIPERLIGDVNSPSWEGSCSLSADGKTLYFSSERKGGFGGKDIYKSILQADGSWGSAINMGEKINTAYDEDGPFIHPDGRILVYSSKGKSSMGGYDIFRTVYNPADSAWTIPENMGYPINSPDDDIYYVLTASGEYGYYSSGKDGGSGLQDIYRVYPGLVGLSPYLALLKGTITLDNVPVEGKVSIDIEGRTENYTFLNSNVATGKYLVNLPGGSKYNVTFKYEGQQDQVRTIDLTTIKAYEERIVDINFSTTKADTIKDVAVKSNAIKDLKADPSKLPDVNENDLNQNKNKTGNETTTGLIFKVQIAAYTMPENYDYSKIKHLGKVDKNVIDGIARFTIGGEFNSLNEANTHCAKVRAAGQSDAFVTAIYNGKRVYLEELEKQGIIPVQPK
ncbi:MAG: PD40 domain-containing protein [Bacteroidetes bacterium]|nr:PD40 domain-containing protein [Bacteroidota bacterium]